ncbi:MAG TPA: hypothetical protein VKB35_17705 [Ktedonobacteraceae bacterium]|nr:hypothetical protein [Ktedonobacteraceae bacterium]
MSYERPVGVRDTRVCGSCSARVDEEDVGRLPALAGRPEIDRLHICGPRGGDAGPACGAACGR